MRGLSVGHATDAHAGTGCTVVLGPTEGMTAAAYVRGRATGTREFDTLPAEVQERVRGFPREWQEKYFGELATPSEFPLSWHWYSMRVGQLVYPYIREGRVHPTRDRRYSPGTAPRQPHR